MRHDPPPLFADQRLAESVLGPESPLYGTQSVASALESMWHRFAPYTDPHLHTEFRRAYELLRIAMTDDRAFHPFLQRYWELHLGTMLLDAGAALGLARWSPRHRPGPADTRG